MKTLTNVLQYAHKYIEMKEAELIKMKHDIRLTQQALVVALDKIEKLEQKVFEKVDGV